MNMNWIFVLLLYLIWTAAFAVMIGAALHAAEEAGELPRLRKAVAEFKAALKQAFIHDLTIGWLRWLWPVLPRRLKVWMFLNDGE